jgi:hypothetical protein
MLSPSADHLRQRAAKLTKVVRLLPIDARLFRDEDVQALAYQVVYEAPVRLGNPVGYVRRLCDRLFRVTGPHDAVYVDDLT